MAKWVYMFTEGNADMRNLLGGKGANLAEMTNLGLPVPQGFTVTTEACTQYYEDGRQINDEIMGQIMEAIDKMEGITGKKFGDAKNPLLVSVRSGARASMPGMMDTILNLGLNEEVVETLSQASGNPRWAWDCYRRFIQMFSDVVMEVGKKYFEELIDKMKEEKGVQYDIDLTAADLKTLAEQYAEVDFVYPMHLNPNVRKPIHEIFGNAYLPNLFFIEPLEYLPFVYLMEKSTLVLTDSGGIQEEAPGLGKPVLVMRDTTERPEALDAGTMKLVGTDYARIVTEVSHLLDDNTYYNRMSQAVNPYGDGTASQRIVQTIEKVI